MKFNFWNNLKANGHYIKLPSNDKGVYPNITHLWLNEILEKYINQPNPIFVDVGMNIGQTLISVKTGNMRNIRYFGFEPNINSFMYVYNLIKLNSKILDNVEIFPFGLSNKNKIENLYLRNKFDDCASLVSGFREDEYYNIIFMVPVFNGDQLFSNFDLNSQIIIKIDVEGSELEVIKGLNKIIVEHRPYIICEILPVYDEFSEIGRFRFYRQNEIESILSLLKYTIYRIENSNNIEKVKSIGVHSQVKKSNYLFIPN